MFAYMYVCTYMQRPKVDVSLRAHQLCLGFLAPAILCASQVLGLQVAATPACFCLPPGDVQSDLYTCVTSYPLNHLPSSFSFWL